MRIRKLSVWVITAALSCSISTAALAGEWKADETGYWYQNDDGSYPADGWQWIDDDDDGIAERYYFDADGYCLTDTMTPDGFLVSLDGAWVVDGVVQTMVLSAEAGTQAVQSAAAETQAVQSAAAGTGTARSAAGSSGISAVPFDGYTIVVNTNTHKYHRPGCKSVKDIKPANIGYSDNQAYLDASGYVPCKRCH